MTVVTESLRDTQVGGSALLQTDALVASEPRVPMLPETDEVFRGIYTRAGIGVPETLLVSSAIAGEGKTTVALGLATAVAQDLPHLRVLLVETDMRRPVLAGDFALDSNPGLADCLLNGQPLEFAYRPTYLSNLDLLPAGGRVDNPARLLRSSRMAHVLDMARQTHDLIILDAPAVLLNSDTLPLCDLADAVLMVVRAGITPLAQVNQAIDQLDERKLRGVVINGTDSAIPGWLRRLGGV